jgi:hypothetical protein
MNALAFGEYELKLLADTEGPKAVVAAGYFAGRAAVTLLAMALGSHSVQRA